MLNPSSAARAQGIQWTRPYLVELCDRIRQALEAWAGQADATAPDLDQARDDAAQLAASLETLNVPGAADLAGTLTSALDAIEKPDAETATVLLESVAVLPDYLERLETGAPDLPDVLAEFIDRTRAAAGLAPAAGKPSPDGIAALNDDDSGEYESLDPAALRREYQRALRDWLRDADRVEPLRQFTQRLQAADLLQLRRLGRVAEAAFSGLAGGQLAPGPDIQAHLASMDQVLHRLGEGDDGALAEADSVATALLGDLESAEPGCPEIDRIGDGRSVERDAEIERARSVLSGRNRELFTAMAEAARGELNQAKDALNEFLLGRETAGEGVADQAALLRSVAESFGMLGLARLKERVNMQAERLGELTADPENPVLLDVARELLLVESELDEAVLYLGEAPESRLLEGDGEHLPKAEHRRVMRQVLGESLDDLGQAKHLLDQVHRGQGEDDSIDQASRILARVAGVLFMAGQAQAAEMLEAAGRGIGEVMSADTGDADRDHLEQLAEALVVVEFYLDSLSRLDDRGVGYLQDARKRLIELGDLEPPAEAPVAGEPAGEEPEAAEPTDFAELAGETPAAEEPPDEEEEPLDFAELQEAEQDAADEQAGAPVSAEAPESFDFAELQEPREDAAAEPEEEATERAEESEPEETAEDVGESAPMTIEFESVPVAEAGTGEEAADEPADEFESIDFDLDTPPEHAEGEQAEPEDVEATGEAEPESEHVELPGHEPAADESETVELPAETGEETHEEPAAVPEEEPEAGERPEAASALADDDFDLMSIFLEEFDDELANLRERFPRWRETPTDTELLTEIRRSFHTLKGSGRMAGAERIGEFAWTVEQTLNQTLDGQHRPEDVVELTGEAIDALPSLRARLVGEEAVLDEATIDELARRIDAVGEEADLPELQDLDPTLIQLMIKEIGDHLESIDRWIEQSRDSGWSAPVDRDLIRSVHTIKGTLRLAPIGDEAESMQVIEEYLQELVDTDAAPDDAAVALMEDLRAMIGKRLARLQREAVSTDHFDTAALAAEARALISRLHHEAEAEHERSGAEAPEVSEAEEAEAEQAEAGEAEAEEAEAEEAEAEQAEAEQAEAEQAEAEEAEQAEAEEAEAEEAEAEEAEAEEAEQAEAGEAEAEQAEAEQAEAGEAEAEQAEAGEAGEAEAGEAEAGEAEAEEAEAEQAEAEQAEAEQAEAEEADLGVEEVPELETEAGHFDEEIAGPEPEPAEPEEAEPGVRFEEWPDRTAEVVPPPAPPAPAAEPEPRTAGSADTVAIDYSALDEELLELFLEEGRELLDHSDGLLQQWRENPEDRQLVTALQRDVHTVKGSARMAGLNPIGEVAHVLEDLLESIAGGQQEATPASIETLESGCDHLHAMLEAVDERKPLPARTESEPLETAEEDYPELETATARVDADPREAAGAAARSGTIRLTADEVEELLNFAGEVSIFRSRIEQEIGAFRGNIGEVEQTIARLREQLRKLEQETEAQILSRYEREHGMPDSTFDPLELDRYSTIQQLSRALAESVSDLNSLTELMDDAGRQSETLLMQQARVNTELQEGLMQARMVSFNTLAPRLRRVVRNAARDAGRKAELKIQLEGEGELDRNVLDRVTAPIEHILRNAVAHGIETPGERREAGKPESGTITISIEREATELLIRVGDDGGGLDLDRIRARALEMDLLTPDQAEDEEQLTQVIFQTGFSTAGELSELAGRGVGMDVVSSEVRQIGGRIAVDTRAGQGTRFTLRIPLSLAVMQAIFVHAGERLFSIPLQAVRGVARIQPAEWREALDTDGTYRYGGEEYPLIELESQLGFEPLPVEDASLSLLMIEAGEERAAMRVADIEGHREIVLKPVGPQISSIPGILGGTIMGDGQVVVILDVAPMIERALSERRLPGVVEVERIEAEEAQSKRTPLVMVVDDSITMRRVTARILEHHGLEVVTARDGVEAVDQLYERVPDLMLLDIEMPRMDGFELARHVRDDSRLHDVTIMMITSRSGDKHREHARKLGVNRYLIKPYQEANMVRNVFEMLDMPVPGVEE